MKQSSVIKIMKEILSSRHEYTFSIDELSKEMVDRKVFGYKDRGIRKIISIIKNNQPDFWIVISPEGVLYTKVPRKKYDEAIEQIKHIEELIEKYNNKGDMEKVIKLSKEIDFWCNQRDFFEGLL